MNFIQNLNIRIVSELTTNLEPLMEFFSTVLSQPERFICKQAEELDARLSGQLFALAVSRPGFISRHTLNEMFI